MKCKLLFIGMLVSLLLSPTFAQNPESFFPHNVGDRWEYYFSSGDPYTRTITRDSVGMDSSLFLFYNNWNEPGFLLDTSNNVYFPFNSCNFLIYKLDADSGQVWETGCISDWVWVSDVYTGLVFGKPTEIKVFQFGPVKPDTINEPYVLVERWLAKGYGLIYEWEEAGYFSSLIGCIINGDTSGYVTSVVPTKHKVPLDFTLHQNYPNPFNPSTKIEFELPHETEISLTVYDILGRQAAILHKGYLKVGNYKVQWNAEELASGLYICRLQAGKFTKSIKMLLTK